MSLAETLAITYCAGVLPMLSAIAAVSFVRRRKQRSTASPFSAIVAAALWPLMLTGALATAYAAGVVKLLDFVVGDR